MTADTLFADRYRLERRLGTGGMATVQLALDTRLERYVAVKLLAEHLAQDASFVSRFKREALAAARLVHPNIVQVFDTGADEASGRHFIVMEFVDGPSCADILKELGRLDPDDAVSILTQACRGLDYAHRNGVVHRDVKPGNLLRSRDGGQVKLADFGIAKAAEHSDMTKVGSVLGTAAYLSPEQARGEPAGPPADLYALGVVSYQLLAGRLPYEAASLTDARAPAGHDGPDAAARARPRDPAAALARRVAGARARPRRPLRRCRRDGAGARGRDARRRARADGRDARARRHRRHADARPHVGHHAARPHAGRARPAAPDGADRRAAAPPGRRAPGPRRRSRGGAPPPRRRPARCCGASSCSRCSPPSASAPTCS